MTHPSPPLDAATLRAVKLAREAANGWACFAKRDKEHAEIARIHEALNAIERGQDGHDAQCESELTSHGYTPCRCHERAGICYCRKNPCECLPLADAAAPRPVAEQCDEAAKPEAGPMRDTESPSGVQALGSSGLAQHRQDCGVLGHLFGAAGTCLFCETPKPPPAEAREELERWGIQWRGPQEPISIALTDGYWTPWHLAQERVDTLRAQVQALTEERDAAYGYLSRLFASVAPQCEPLPTLDGLVSQIDNAFIYVREQAARTMHARCLAVVEEGVAGLSVARALVATEPSDVTGALGAFDYCIRSMRDVLTALRAIAPREEGQ